MFFLDVSLSETNSAEIATTKIKKELNETNLKEIEINQKINLEKIKNELNQNETKQIIENKINEIELDQVERRDLNDIQIVNIKFELTEKINECNDLNLAV